MTGASALRLLEASFADPSEVRELARLRQAMRFAGTDAAGDVELLQQYAQKLGVLIDSVDHRPGGRP
jgi:hypothetical protein